MTERVDYRDAGTVEMIFDVDREEFYFLEMNTRIQLDGVRVDAGYRAGNAVTPAYDSPSAAYDRASNRSRSSRPTDPRHVAAR